MPKGLKHTPLSDLLEKDEYANNYFSADACDESMVGITHPRSPKNIKKRYDHDSIRLSRQLFLYIYQTSN